MTDIVLSFDDGTGGTVPAAGNGNVVRRFEMLSNDGPMPVPSRLTDPRNHAARHDN